MIKIWSIIFTVIGTILTLIFLILKAADIIDWGWFIIALPILIGWGSPVLVLCIFGFIMAFVYLIVVD
jgi:hypothetical protein